MTTRLLRTRITTIAATALLGGLGVVAARLPLAGAYGLAWGYSIAWGVVLPHYQPFTALMLVLYEVARRLPMRRARPYLALATLPWSLNTANVAALSGASGGGILVTAGLWGVMTLLVWMAGRVAYRTAETLRLREEVLAVQVQLARQQDRVALARELHDVLSHSIGAIAMQAAGARALSPRADDRIAGALDAIVATSTDAMQELRRLLGFLQDRGARVDDPASATTPGRPEAASLARAALAGGEIAGVEALAAATRACGLRVDVRRRGDPAGLAAPTEHVAYRVVQEGLANALRHQGRGCRVDVLLDWAADSLTVIVDSAGGAGRDDALAQHGSGTGLAGMAERLAELGGRLEAGPTPGGFRLVAVIPR